MENGSRRIIRKVILLWVLVGVVAFAGAYDGSEGYRDELSGAQQYLVPVNSAMAAFTRLGGDEILCVAKQCYMVTTLETAEWYASTQMAEGAYEPVTYYDPFAPAFTDLLRTTPAPPSSLTQRQWGPEAEGWNNVADLISFPNLPNPPVVAIIDTGMALHDEFTTAVLYTDVSGKGYVPDDNYAGTTQIYDKTYHGTHVAGIIGGTKGISGGKYMQGTGFGKVKILPLMAADDTGKLPLTNILKAINKIYTLKSSGVPIVAVNMSYGSTSFSQAEYDAIQSLKDIGIIAVVAAGNDGADLSRTAAYPANYNLDNIITVTAVQRSGSGTAFWSQANYGGPTSIAAPGAAIYSTYPYYVPSTSTPNTPFLSTTASGNVSGSATGTPYGALSFILSNPTNVQLTYSLPDGNVIDDYPVVRMESNTAVSAPFKYDSVSVIMKPITPNTTMQVYASGGTQNGYSSLSGTSMATPFVTGAIGAAFALRSSLTPEQAVTLLYGYGKVNPSLSGKVQESREIDLYAFLRAVEACSNCSSYTSYPPRSMTYISSGGGGGGCAMNPEARFNLSGLVLAVALFILYRKRTAA